MFNIRYTVLYKTGNDFELVDEIECTWYWVDENTPTSELLTTLRDMIREDFGKDAWLGRWEVEEI